MMSGAACAEKVVQHAETEDLIRGSGFVYASGTGFKLDGEDFYFQGANLYRLAELDQYSESQVYDVCAQLGARGFKVVRFWGFSCAGASGGQPMIASVRATGNSYNEAALRRLDVALDAARSAGLKVILPLVNFEDPYCGMSWWVQELLQDKDKQKFYTDSTVLSAYERWLSDILNRTNSRYSERYGLTINYKDDPTILSIEVANEPHTQDDYERARGLRPGSLTHDWLDVITTYARTIDTRHLISAGEEGYRTADLTGHGRGAHAWIDNGQKGVDFAADIALRNVDFATVHIYPDNWQIPSSEMDWVDTGLVADRAAIAHASGKPIIMEETGFSMDAEFSWLGYQGDRRKYLEQIYAFANAANYAGTMIWEALPTGLESGGYVVTFDDPAFAAIAAQADYMNARSKGSPPVTGGESTAATRESGTAPECTGSTDSDPNGTGWGWESGRSCRFVYCTSGSDSDPARDGWGWENGRSCRIPFCLKPGSANPDGDGWGWENGRSCIVKG